MLTHCVDEQRSMQPQSPAARRVAAARPTAFVAPPLRWKASHSSARLASGPVAHATRPTPTSASGCSGSTRNQ